MHYTVPRTHVKISSANHMTHSTFMLHNFVPFYHLNKYFWNTH